MDLTQVLKDAGYQVVEGKDAVLDAIKSVSDGSTGRLCSGYRVFPGGDKCDGCSNCQEAIDS